MLISHDSSLNLLTKERVLPWHISPWNPELQVQVPVETSQIPWFEQLPSPGHRMSVDEKYI